MRRVPEGRWGQTPTIGGRPSLCVYGQEFLEFSRFMGPNVGFVSSIELHSSHPNPGVIVLTVNIPVIHLPPAKTQLGDSQICCRTFAPTKPFFSRLKCVYHRFTSAQSSSQAVCCCATLIDIFNVDLPGRQTSG